MINQILPFLKNVKGSIKSTIVGSLILLFDFYLIYSSYVSEKPITTIDFAVDITLVCSLFVVGLVLLFLSDVIRKDKDEKD